MGMVHRGFVKYTCIGPCRVHIYIIYGYVTQRADPFCWGVGGGGGHGVTANVNACACDLCGLFVAGYVHKLGIQVSTTSHVPSLSTACTHLSTGNHRQRLTCTIPCTIHVILGRAWLWIEWRVFEGERVCTQAAFQTIISTNYVAHKLHQSFFTRCLKL